MAVPREAFDAALPALREAVLAWYGESGRTLAFRATRDPYAILVSELMAQQTQAARAAQAWQAWMTRFPTVQALAAAPVADVLRAWAGLGYNRRAIALHRAAQAIVVEHGGEVPATVEALMTLPGVGPYTARAVAAIAFGLPVGAVDTNVRRVLGRIAAGNDRELGGMDLQALADAAVPEGRAGDWTHALMDLGAGPCRSREPRCGSCPARIWCRFAGQGRAPRGVAAPGNAVSRRGAPSRPDGAPRARRSQPPFPSTSRWLRGRILARAREVEDGAWVRYAEPMGAHDRPAVREAIRTMASEGLIEMRLTDAGPEARLPRGDTGPVGPDRHAPHGD